MLVYWLMLLIPGMMYVLLLPLKEDQRNRAVTAAFFLILGAMLVLRGTDCGIDLRTYEYYFRKFAAMPWQLLHTYDLEPGFKCYVKLIASFTDNYQLFIAITSVLYMIPVMYLYQRFQRGSFLKLLLLVNMSVFPMFFSGLRQAMAIAIGVFAYLALIDGRKIRYLLFTGLAWLFHESAFMLLLLYPMYHLRIRQKNTPVIVMGLCALLALNKEIFLLAGKVAALLGSSYVVSATSTGAYMTIVLLFAFFLFSMIMLDEEKADGEIFFLRNILLLALIVQMFSPLHNTVSRLGYYFVLFVPLLIPEVIYRAKRQFLQISVLAQFILCGFFFFYFMESAYTGQDILRIYPYIPFWKGS